CSDARHSCSRCAPPAGFSMSRVAGRMARGKAGMTYAHTLAGTRYVFADLRTLLARATPFRSGDALAGLAAATAAERVAAQMALADLPLATLLAEPVVAYETDEVTRLIIDSHDAAAFAPVASLTVGEFREFL